MNLFLKIFLWFLAAIALMVGVVIFLNWTVQTEPVVGRWQISVRNQMTIYAATAGQILDQEGDAGLRQFLSQIRRSDTIGEVDLIGPEGKTWLDEDIDPARYSDLIARTTASGNVEIDATQPDNALAAKQVRLQNGESYVLLVRWERPRPVALFGDSQMRYLRLGGLLFVALILCYALARYISSPIGKIRDATHRLADGDLDARVADRVGRRGDELAKLARDFDLMAERIGSLITSQQRLTRDVSHELRSPLARLGVALEIAKQKTNGAAAPQLERIENESHRLNEMISRILTLSKLESGSTDLERDDVNLKEVVADVAEDADFEARAKNKSVEVFADADCSVRGNDNLLRSAIENVVRNAVRYTEDGTVVKVILREESGNAVIRVSDAGGGVPEDELKNLFVPFYRVGEARERATGGIGLGLAIAQRAIKAHNGTITAHNEGPGLLVEIRLACR
jgi:two-component system, OmpR family, sensor histidine kinase CpxA